MEAVSRENSFREFCSKERNEGEVGGKWSEEKFFLVLFVFQRERKNSLFLCCSEYCMTQCGGSEKGRVAGAVVLKREEGTVHQGRDGLSWKHRWLTLGDRKEVACICAGNCRDVWRDSWTCFSMALVSWWNGVRLVN